MKHARTTKSPQIMMMKEEIMRLVQKSFIEKKRQKSQNSLKMQMTAETFFSVTKAFVIFGWVTK